jgi:HD-GYP domain-containing protein (c-di-GMP phosphodiesterase class II)
MRSVRAYKDAMTHEEAVAELRRCAGTQFDPAVVRAFVDIVERAGLSAAA